MQFFREAECSTVLESEKSPFWANRLLLPLQSECFRALLEGYHPRDVDKASFTTILPVGQLTMMDNIGLDILRTGVQQYEKYTPFGKVDFDLIQSCLRELIRHKKLGKKNRNGLLMGTKLPWSEKKKNERQFEVLARSFQKAIQRGCVLARQSGEISKGQLRVICEEIFHCENFDEALPHQPL